MVKKEGFKMINKIICLILGHITYNQVVNMGTKREYYNKVCWRCGKITKLKEVQKMIRRTYKINLNIKGVDIGCKYYPAINEEFYNYIISMGVKK